MVLWLVRPLVLQGLDPLLAKIANIVKLIFSLSKCLGAIWRERLPIFNGKCLGLARVGIDVPSKLREGLVDVFHSLSAHNLVRSSIKERCPFLIYFFPNLGCFFSRSLPKMALIKPLRESERATERERERDIEKMKKKNGLH